MDSQGFSSQNRTAGCENPGVFSGSGGCTHPEPSGDRNQSLNAAGSSSDGLAFPPIFSGDEPRPLQTDFFRYASLFFAHLGPEEESEQWASFLPENLRPGNIEEYLEETDNPQLYGNNYWWLSQENSAREQPSFNQSIDIIRYSRAQLLELREVTAIPENILKINQEMEAACPGVNQITERGGTKVENVSLNLMKLSLETGEKAEHEVANISVNSMREAHQTGEKERQGVGNISVNSIKEAPQIAEKEKHEVANVFENSLQGEPQTGGKEKQEGSVSEIKKEKKKHRVLSKERKEKRRIAKKKKRAEKNRKLGVKRLKIQPLSKPKPVSHCRHYLKGRCHEGEKCKFSHDVQPLTKSLPCCHFARQSCMKGEDCPYDHDLSKYPCNKYVSTGFCPRQGNCMFSHKVTPNEDPAPTTSAMKAETKAPNPPPASDSIEHRSHKHHFVFGAHNQQAEVSLNVSASKAVKAPPGVSFLNTGNSQKGKQPVPTSNSADVIMSGKNSNKNVFGGDPIGAVLPSNLPALPHSTGVFMFGKNPPPNHNPPASPNSAGVFMFGKNPLPDHNKRNQPSLLPFGNNNKTRFGGGKKDSAAPSSSPTSAFSSRLNGLTKNTSSSGQSSVLSTSTSGSSRVNGSWTNMNQGTGPVSGSGSKPVESRVNVDNSSKAVKAPPGVSFLNIGNSQKGKQPVPTSNSADVIMSGKNSNTNVFGGDPIGAVLPSNLPALPHSTGFFMFGKNPPPNHNPPASPNSAGVFMFGKNPLPDHNKRNQPSLLPFGNNNKTRFGGGKKDSAAPSSSPTSAFFSRLNGLTKNTSSSGQSSVLSTSTSGSSRVNGSWTNMNQGAGPVSGSGSKPVESRVNVDNSSKAVKAPPGVSFLNIGNSQKGKQPVPTSNSADVIMSGKNSNKNVFGGDPIGAVLPSNLPALPHSTGVFMFGKNPPPNHNPPASPNSAGVFMFGKNPLPDHNKRNQPSLLPFGNNNKTRFGRGKKDSAAPSSSPTSAFSARLNGLTKNTSSSGQSSALSTSASGSSRVNGSWTDMNQGTGPVSGSGSKPVESRVNVDNSASGGASLQKPFSAVEMWGILYGKGTTQ